jgi:hypothetical protein
VSQDSPVTGLQSTTGGGKHSALQFVVAHDESSPSAAFVSQFVPVPMMHAEQSGSAAHAETWLQQLPSRHVPHAGSKLNAPTQSIVPVFVVDATLDVVVVVVLLLLVAPPLPLLLSSPPQAHGPSAMNAPRVTRT